ncbi:heme exporter protein CcmD [Rhizobium sp. FKY42]|uniref:heme exporter protein CcmD n=1 Tax=Rhizobium sp. FKY42 TaxID=2562310 RepID=UPI0010BFD8D6|nr:heme exporter protein CcmD [Rhizobium sp. FKY42]
MSHAFYIYTSYGVTALITFSLIAWTVLDGRARRREMAELEAAGIRRRSSVSAHEGKQA